MKTQPNRGQRITRENCKVKTGFSWSNLISLTGIQGVHNLEEVITFDRKKLSVIEFGSMINIEIHTDVIQELIINIIREDAVGGNYLTIKWINNDSLQKQSDTLIKNVGYDILYAQVHACEKNNIQYLVCDAAGDRNENNYIGFYLWGKLGYLMDVDAKKDFLKLVKNTSFSHAKDLNELIHMPNGKDFWLENGFPWVGTFTIKKYSKSIKILKKIKRSQ